MPTRTAAVPYASAAITGRMLALSAAEFRKLVSAGALPPPARIGTHERWNVDQLRAILRGDAARPNDDFE